MLLTEENGTVVGKVRLDMCAWGGNCDVDIAGKHKSGKYNCGHRNVGNNADSVRKFSWANLWHSTRTSALRK
eukprot:110808-Prorocentrum_lima.AAC.1